MVRAIADHLGWLPWIEDGLSRSLGDVLSCFVEDRQWLVQRADVAATIFDEEEKYIDLLEKAPKIVGKVVAKRGWSEETKTFLADTHGIDPETSQLIVDGHWEETP